MAILNLEVNNGSQKAVKEYLQENVSQVLADKINNGVRVEKDGKTLVNKKDLDGFWAYATNKARELKSQYVENDTVFGWAVHYFEEDSIEGTLYNEDGSKYEKPIPKATYKSATVPVAPAKPTPPKPKQFTLFDIFEEEEKKDEPVVEESVVNNPPEETDSDVCTLDVDEETGEIIQATPTPPAPQRKGTLIYQKYLSYKSQYPNHIVAYRLGDFYEFFGDDAVRLSRFLNLVLTGRDCGLDERVPMVGLPYHAAEPYFFKIATKYALAIVDNDEVSLMEQEELLFVNENITEEERRELFEDDLPEKAENAPTVYEDNDFDKERALQQFFDKDALCVLHELFDYSLDLQ